jgi:hypothetical protein
VLDASGKPYAEAGGHPDRLEVAVAFNVAEDAAERDLKDIEFDFPPGFAGDPNAVPACPRSLFDEGVFTGETCDPQSQVGVVSFRFESEGESGEVEEPLFNVEPAAGEPSALGSNLFFKSLRTMHLRPGDFGVTIEQRNIPQGLPVIDTRVELWGIPADHQSGTEIPRRPYLTLPARCDRGPLAVTARVRSWQQPDVPVSASGDTGLPLGGCDSLPFEPTMSFQLDNRSADGPSGAVVDLAIPQSTAADGHVASPVRSVRIALPEGVSLSPTSTEGLTSCPDTALHPRSDLPAACPASSRIGVVELSTPSLREPLRGTIYLGQEQPGERFRLFVVAEGPGVAAKLVGRLEPDPRTERLTATLDALPEVSFSHIALRFDGGPQGLLATPIACGAPTATATFGRYGDARTVQSSNAVIVDRGPEGAPCAAAPPFSPQLSSGPTRLRAGRGTGLVLTLRRQAGEQPLSGFTAALPVGMSAALGSLAICGESAAASGGCGVAARVGSATAAVGSGPNPVTLYGDVYVTGPYRRAPFGLALVFDATLGPFDLGTIVTRAGLRMDPQSGRVTVGTDPLPQAVDGLPIRIRQFGIELDRPGFLRAPTSCGPGSIGTVARSVSGATSRSSNRISVRGCERLRFAPSLSLRFTGRTEVRRGGSPGLRIGIRSPRGSASLRSADIALPPSLRAKADGPGATVCARQDALEGNCPDSSQVGQARGSTPLLRKPFSGSIHIVQPEGSGPPELWTSLEATGFRLNVRGEAFARDGRLHMRLTGLPDVPLSSFVMHLDGGEGGLFALTAEPCSGSDRRQIAKVSFEGQNMARRVAHEPIGHPGCGAHG